MNKSVKNIFVAALIGLSALSLLYITRPKPKINKKILSPVFATSSSCGDLVHKKVATQIIDESGSSEDISAALYENATALPPYVLQLLEKNRFKIQAFKPNEVPTNCQYKPDSLPGRTQLCVNSEKRRMAVILRKSEKAKYTPESQIDEALLPGVFSLVYDYFWFSPEQKRKEILDGMGASNGNKTFDASARPLSPYQKFDFWRYTTISKLKFSSDSDFPFFEFQGSGPLSASFVRRSLNLLSRDYYCRPDSHKNFADTQPDFYKEFSNSIACILGKPWFMKDEEFKTNCSNPS